MAMAWFIGRLLACWLVGWLAGWPVGWPIGWSLLFKGFPMINGWKWFNPIAVILKLAVQRVSNDMGTVTQILGGHSTMDPPSLLPAGGVPRR